MVSFAHIYAFHIFVLILVQTYGFIQSPSRFQLSPAVQRNIISNGRRTLAMTISITAENGEFLRKDGNILSRIRRSTLFRLVESSSKRSRRFFGLSLIILGLFAKSLFGFQSPSVASSSVSSSSISKTTKQSQKQSYTPAKVVKKVVKHIEKNLKSKSSSTTTTPPNILEDGLMSLTDAAVQSLEEAEHEAVSEVARSWQSLSNNLSGLKLDSLFLLIVTSTIVPLFKKLKTSPIIGFLITGTLLGPTGLNWVSDVHMIDVLGELGIIFFLFEMGLELSLERLNKMRRDVFGLGTSQFVLTALAFTGVSKFFGINTAGAVTIGGSLALSSSAFVLQLLKDKNAMGTRHGKASFGILLLQDLAVVPLIVVVELLSKGGTGLAKALSIAGIKALVTLTAMSYVGRRVLDPIFFAVAKSSSQEAFLSIILGTVLMMSYVTQGIGLSDTLGAFLAGLLLAETKYRYQIEADIAPFRGLLLGVFFITVGFSIDLNILVSQFSGIIGLLAALLIGKATIIAGLCRLFGLPLPSAIQCGLLNAQVGEFAFVALGIAERAELIPVQLSKMLLTTVALSMASTPLLAELGSSLASRLDQSSSGALLDEPKSQTHTISSNNFIFVCGYGRIGKMICDMLDRKLIRYVAIESNPQKAREARLKGLPVYFGDVTRPEVLKGFDVGSAEACVVAVDEMTTINKAVMLIRKNFPHLPIIVRAKDAEHQKRLSSVFGKKST